MRTIKRVAATAAIVVGFILAIIFIISSFTVFPTQSLIVSSGIVIGVISWVIYDILGD